MEQRTAREIGSACLGLHVRRTARRLTRIYDDALAPLNLTIGQFSIMTMLAARDAWGMQALADALGTDRSSLTAGLKPLERRQVVESQRDADDKRIRHLALTPHGSALLEDAEPMWRSAQEQVKALLSDEGTRAIRDVSQRID